MDVAISADNNLKAKNTEPFQESNKVPHGFVLQRRIHKSKKLSGRDKYFYTNMKQEIRLTICLLKSQAHFEPIR